MKFIGTEGEKISGKFTLVYVKQVPDPYSYVSNTRLNFVAEGGEKVMLTTKAKILSEFILDSEYYNGYFSTKYAIGKTFDLEFVVKKHLQYGDFKTTIVKNAKLIENISEVA
jgi:hypothetical protein